MARRITLILFTTSIFSFILTTFITLIYLGQQPIDHNRMHCDMSGIAYPIGWAIIILLTLSSTTIYLNLFKEIRTNSIYKLLSFLLVPFVITVCLLWYSGLLSLPITLPFMGILVFHYLRR